VEVGLGPGEGQGALGKIGEALREVREALR
jgi:hypothetical protein